MSLPIAFEENRGQFDDRTRFLARNAGGAVHFLESGPQFVLGRQKEQIKVELQPATAAGAPTLAAEEAAPGTANYFIGNEASARFQGIPTYRKVRYRNFMTGVDLLFYGTKLGLEHDFIVAPGVHPALVRFRMNGAQSIRLTDAGELSIRTANSEMLFRKPVAYQRADGKKISIVAGFIANNDNTISFRVGKYDRRRELVIDPVLVFSTYLDGTHSDTPTTIATDTSGNIYVAGYTTSQDFPVANAYQTVCGLCSSGGFGESGYVAKLNPTGTTLLYSTYFVGNGQTDISRIKIDPLGNIVGSGYTASTNFPRVGNYAGSYTSGLFVFSLNPAGTTLNHSEIVGAGGAVSGGYGAEFNNPYNMAVDSQRNVYLTGVLSTNGNIPPNFPITQGTYGSGKVPTTPTNMVFVAKLASDGSLVYSTFVPPAGTNDLAVAIGGLAVDSTGNAYVSGTAGTGLLTTANTVSPAFPPSVGGNVFYGGNAGFVLALNAAATQLLFSTYLPGTNNANTLSLAADGSLYVAGTTSEPTLPVSANAFQRALKTGAGCTCDGGYVLRLNSTGTQVLNATYLSGTNDYNNTLTEYGSSALDTSGNIYLGGIVQSTDFPLTNPVVSFFDTTGNIWAGGTILAGLSPDLSTLVFGSYFNGASAGDRLVDMTVGSNNRLVFTGGTYSNSNFPTTANAYQPNVPSQSAGSSHQFVASIDLTVPAPSVCLASTYIYLTSAAVGSTSNSSLNLTNCGNAPLNISSLTSTSPLVNASPGTVSVAPGQSTPLNLQFSPVDTTSVSGTVTVTTNATIPTEKFSFYGQGMGPKLTVLPTLTLGPQVLGAVPAPSSGIFVQNSGNAPLTINSVVIAGQFTQSNSCIRTLAVQAYCFVTVKSAATSVGTLLGTLTLSSNDPVNPQTNVAITDSVLSAFPAPVLTSIGEQTQVTGASNTMTVSGSNFFPQSVVYVNGTAALTYFVSANALQVTFDPTTISTIGEIPITVVNPSPGGGVSVPITLTLYKSVAIPGLAMISIPATGKLYVSSYTSTSNTVTPIDPATGIAGTPISVGSYPALMAASTDGAYLFVANAGPGAYTIQRIATAINTVDRTFPYPPNVFCSACTAPPLTSIQGVPGSPTSFVVAQGAYLSLYNDSGLAFELSTPTYGSLNTNLLAFSGTPIHLYSAPFSTTDNFFNQFTVSGASINALTTTATASTITNESDSSIAAAGTQIYTTSGNVWDSTNKHLLGTIPTSLYGGLTPAIAVDPALTRVYYGGLQTSGLVVTAYDTKTLSSQASLNFGNSLSIRPTNLARWGADGFGFLDGSSLILFRSSLLAGTAPAALPAPFGNLESVTDSVTGSTTVSTSNSLFVQGWAADVTDGAPVSNVKVYLDGNLIGTPTVVARPDVASAFSNSAYTNSGYQLTYSAASLSVATHSVTVVASDSGGRSTTFGPIPFTVTSAPPPSPPFGNLESATDSVTGSTTVSTSDSLFVQGWVADATDGAPVSNVKVYLDGNLIGTPTVVARPDVASAFSNGAYTNSGYQLTYSAASLSVATHSVTAIAIDSGGRSTTFGPLNFTVITTRPPSPPFGNLESATDSVTGGTTVSTSDSLFVQGWAADVTDGAPVSNVKVYLDGNLIGTPTVVARPDVASAFSNSAYTNSGYQLTYSAASLSVATHSVTAIAIDSGGRSTTFGPITITVH